MPTVTAVILAAILTIFIARLRTAVIATWPLRLQLAPWGMRVLDAASALVLALTLVAGTATPVTFVALVLLVFAAQTDLLTHAIPGELFDLGVALVLALAVLTGTLVPTLLGMAPFGLWAGAMMLVRSRVAGADRAADEVYGSGDVSLALLAGAAIGLERAAFASIVFLAVFLVHSALLRRMSGPEAIAAPTGPAFALAALAALLFAR